MKVSHILVALIAATGGTFAVDASAKEITLDELRQIQGKMKASDDLAVDFTQTSFTAIRGKTRKREGKALFAKPDKFKWMLGTSPQEFKLYDGKDFFDYTPATKSAVRYSPTGPKAYELREMVDLVLNFEALLKRYDLVKANKDGDVVKIELKPKIDAEITAVELHLAVSQSYISYLKLTLKNKNHMAHDFKNPSRKALSADSFKIPKGVRITDSN